MSATLSPLPNHAVVDVRPGDLDTATEVDGWLQEYAVSRDPQLREKIVLAYLGLADRLAGRYRTSRGSNTEDLVQTARPGSSWPLTATTPTTAPHSSPTRWPVWSASSNGTCVTPAGGCMCPARSRNERCECAGPVTSCTSSWAAHPPRPSCRGSLGMGEEEVLEGSAAMSSRMEVSLDRLVGVDGYGSFSAI